MRIFLVLQYKEVYFSIIIIIIISHVLFTFHKCENCGNKFYVFVWSRIRSPEWSLEIRLLFTCSTIAFMVTEFQFRVMISAPIKNIFEFPTPSKFH